MICMANVHRITDNFIDYYTHQQNIIDLKLLPDDKMRLPS